MPKFIPREKLSKKARRALDAEKRIYNKSWGKEQKSGQSKPNQVK